ncbi:uncharacterized protein TRUGW13939_01919 [Talaromyces rugulosus]|uniref:Uncharacterized protein n=1 Tax=Talaromyces rugulosus TaxID=121627 RepID=A0A7H8QLL4_TALRU|nr:uncharacterized protein TRUGW13939_01919 [Talaromyces rugulosus]QKX54830.1 hypothetical protein TRUGW13939_01919 [Talaromyces rugulosus]
MTDSNDVTTKKSQLLFLKGRLCKIAAATINAHLGKTSSAKRKQEDLKTSITEKVKSPRLCETSSSALPFAYDIDSKATAPLVLEDPDFLPPRIENISDGSIVNLAGSPLQFSKTDSTFVDTLRRYFSPGDFQIGSHAQITTFKKQRWLMWDPEGQNRLMVFIVYQDVQIRRGESQPALAKAKSFYAIAVSTHLSCLAH